MIPVIEPPWRFATDQPLPAVSLLTSRSNCEFVFSPKANSFRSECALARTLDRAGVVPPQIPTPPGLVIPAKAQAVREKYFGCKIEGICLAVVMAGLHAGHPWLRARDKTRGCAEQVRA
jgi:hypothetical protein